jgi:oligopeptidase B
MMPRSTARSASGPRPADGVQVPVSLVYRGDLDRSKPQPLLLYGYGSYGISMDPMFNPARLSLLDRGFIYAIAHIRGGSEMGRWWYEEQGKLMQKMNTFHDFIACAEHLIAKGYTAPTASLPWAAVQAVCSWGPSSIRPELWRGVVAIVPFVDSLTTMLDPSIPLTTQEYEEWGNPEEPEVYHYMLQYSPYDNVQRQAYPAVWPPAATTTARCSTGSPPSGWPASATTTPARHPSSST